MQKFRHFQVKKRTQRVGDFSSSLFIVLFAVEVSSCIRNQCQLLTLHHFCHALILSPIFFSDQTGYFFPGLVKNTSKFIKPCSKEIIDWIKSLQGGKQKVFLLTNSYINYTNLLMNYAVG